MKVGLIYQPCGLGDILFLQKLAYTMQNKGYTVWWPVISEFVWLKDYIANFNFVSWEDDQDHKDGPPLAEHVQFPFKDYYWPYNDNAKDERLWFFQGFSGYEPIMAGKYNSIGIDWSDWRDYVLFGRDPKKEDELYYNVLGLQDDDQYVVINRNYRTHPHPQYFDGISIDPNHYGMRVVEMAILSEFNIFDWCKVFENAKRVDMIETSVNYMLECPQLFDTMKQKELNLYSSKSWFGEVDYLFQLPWNYR